MSRSKPNPYVNLPLIYACSGCSGAAQLANRLAVQSDREQLAQMSCISGVGGDVKALVKVAKSGRPMMVLDGCPLHCAKNCLKRHGVEPTLHIDLSDHGIKKSLHTDIDTTDGNELMGSLVKPGLVRISQKC